MSCELKFTQSDNNVQYLMSTDEMLSVLIKTIDSVIIPLETDGFKCIVKYIIGQQISDKARATIWKRLCKKGERISPKGINNMKDEELMQIGLSGRKVEYIKTLAHSVINGAINFEKFNDLSNNEIIEILTSVRGIGRWTAEMYLIFSLGRLDVLSTSDGTIRRSLQWMYGLNGLPTSKEIVAYFKKWTGYETIISAYFWESIALGFQNKPFETLFIERGG